MDENQEMNQEQQEQPQEEPRFTQAEVDAIISKKFAKWKKDQQAAEDAKAQALKDDATKLRDITSERDSYQTELEMIRRENFLLRHGIEADDVDYYVYKITKSMNDDDDFEDAAKKFLKEHKPKANVRVDMGARLSGGNGGKRTANETMNDLLRAARG